MNILYNYGYELNKKYDLSNIRKILNISTNIWFQNLLNSDNIEQYIKSNINYLLNNYYLDHLINKNYDIIIRNNKSNDNYELKWHLDDQKLIIHKINNLNNLHNLNIIHINDKYIYALYSIKIPSYTIIIYLDTYKIDFIGGKIHFIDKNIEPYKGMLLYFDSRDIHRVSKFIRGIRRCIVLKFYL